MGFSSEGDLKSILLWYHFLLILSMLFRGKGRKVFKSMFSRIAPQNAVMEGFHSFLWQYGDKRSIGINTSVSPPGEASHD